MNYYKILYQSNKKSLPLYKQLNLEESTLIGNQGYSYGIKYSPEKYQDWLLNEKVFEVFVHSSVKQLMMTNYKFLYLINNQEDFNLNIVRCVIEDYDIEDLLQGEDLEPTIINSLLEDDEYRIIQVYFRSKEKNLITLKSNGVLGIDKELSNDELTDIKNLIDLIGFGPVMIS